MSNIGNKETMSQNLNYYIESIGKDKKTVADDLNIGHSTFYSWCNATAYPRIDKIELLAKYFNIDKMDLIEEHDQNYKEKKAIEHMLNNSDKRILAYAIALMDDTQVEKLKKMIEIIK